jgi:hypothetical protein
MSHGRSRKNQRRSSFGSNYHHQSPSEMNYNDPHKRYRHDNRGSSNFRYNHQSFSPSFGTQNNHQLNRNSNCQLTTTRSCPQRHHHQNGHSHYEQNECKYNDDKRGENNLMEALSLDSHL